MRSRERQLELMASNLQRLAETYDRAAEAVMGRIRALPDGAAMTGGEWLSAQMNTLRQIDEELTRLERDFGDLLDSSMLASAQQVAERQIAIESLIGATPDQRLAPVYTQTAILTDGAKISTQFGTLAREAVNEAANRYYADGLKLSDRLYSLDLEGRKLIEDALIEGIASGAASRDIAKQIEDALARAGAGNPRFRAMTIAQSEINTSFRESSVRATRQPGGQIKPYVKAVGWRLSMSHRIADRCDIYAADDTGLGAGNYLPENVPTSHPRCLCVTLPILLAFPDEQFVRKAPDASGVPAAEVARLANRENDPVAQRWMAGRPT